MKKIINVVFYNFYEENTERRAATIFYRDGSVENVDYEDGITACEQIVKERNITSKDAFKQMINDEIVYVMSREDFIDKFSEFVNKEPIERETINEAVVEAMPKQKTKADDHNITTDEEIKNEVTPVGKSIASRLKEADKEDEDDYEDDYDDEDDYEEDDSYGVDENIKTAEEIEETDEEYDDFFDDEEDEELVIEGSDADEEDEELVIEGLDKETDTAKEVDEFDTDDYEDELNDEFDTTIEDKNVVEVKEQKKAGFFKKQINKLKNGAAAVRGLVISLAVVTGLGGAAYALKGSKTGEMLKQQAKSITTFIDNDEDDLSEVYAAENYVVNLHKEPVLDGVPKDILKSVGAIKTGNNDDYNDYTYEQLLEVTDNESQKTAMTNLGTTIMEFNGSFADAYVEEDKDIRAALKVEEVEALQVAYNDYSKDELKAIFNGTEVRADRMSMDYKAASLQLMGAYVIETSENPVNMSYLLETKEGKDFYNRYHTMYLEAKEATGQDKLDKVNAFYAEVKKDFPITNDVRTEGIAHADAYATLESYKLAVTPMIAAAEMEFQNLEIDYTLNDTEIDFINDIGLCNYADDTFERLETITLSADEDKTNPTELQYRNALIKVLTDENHYVIDDLHRELSRLDRFQLEVNGHFDVVETGYGYTTIGGESSSYTESSSSSTETEEWEESETTYTTETTTEEKEIPADEKAKIDEQTNKENEEAKQKAEEEAKKKQDELQAKADEEAKKKQEEAEKQNEETEKKIKDANDQINKNNKDQDTSNDKKINEKDINANVDPDHKDENGNINDSVKDITTDGTNDQTDKDLPDPNETGKTLDNNQPEYKQDSNTSSNVTEFKDISEDDNEDDNADDNKNTTSGSNEGASTEYPEGTKFYDDYGNVYDTYEDLINAYVNNYASETASSTDAKQYTK